MKKQDKFFVKMLFLTTVLVVVVISVISFAVYSYSSRKIKTSMSDVSIKLLNQIESFADTYVFRSAEIFVAQNFMSINGDSDISKIYGNQPLEKSFLYRYYTELSAIVSEENFIKSVHIYVPHRSMIISSDTICYLDDGNRTTEFIQEKKPLFERANRGEKWIATYRNTNSENVMTLLVSYSPYNEKTPLGIIAIDILEESIQSAFSDISRDISANIAILDEKGNMVSNSDKSLLYKDVSNENYVQKILESDSQSGYFISSIDGREQFVSYIKSGYNSWIYLSTQEIGTVFGANRFLLVFTLVFSFLAILLGFFGSYLLSNNYYLSIRNIVELVAGGVDDSRTNDIYEFLKNSVYGMSNDIKKYHKLKTDIVPAAKNNLAFNLTHNLEIDSEYLNQQYEILGIEKDTFTAFAVCNCRINSIENKTGAYFEYGLVEYLYSLSDQERMFLCCGGGIQPVTIVVCAKNRNAMRLSEIVERVQQTFSELKLDDYTIFVSEIVDSIHDLAKSYANLNAMGKYSFILNDAQILKYRELAKRETSSARLEHETLFAALSKSMDAENVNETLMCISEMMTTLKLGSFSYDYIQEFLLSLIEFVLSYMKENQIDMDDIGLDKEALYQEYRAAHTVDSIMGFIQSLCANIVYRNSGATRENEISKKVISFVKELPDTEMKKVTLMFVADKLFLSQAYISRTFRSETGVKFLDWLTNEKLERSARILKNRSIKIKEVCEMMGYSNSNYFIRKFKEKYGVTPKQYQSKA